MSSRSLCRIKSFQRFHCSRCSGRSRRSTAALSSNRFSRTNIMSLRSAKDRRNWGELPRFENSRNVKMIDHSNRWKRRPPPPDRAVPIVPVIPPLRSVQTLQIAVLQGSPFDDSTGRFHRLGKINWTRLVIRSASWSHPSRAVRSAGTQPDYPAAGICGIVGNRLRPSTVKHTSTFRKF